MIRVAAIRALSAALAAASLSACVSEKAETPAWFDARAAELDAQGTPDLHGIPHGTDANLDPAHWAAIRADMAAAEAAIKNDPRSAPLPPEGAGNEAFEDQAQRDIDATRNKY